VSQLPFLAIVSQAAAQSIDQSQPPIGGLQQQCPAVRAAVLLVEPDNHGPVDKIREQQTLCRGRLGHAKASVVVETLCGNSFLPRGGFSFAYVS
jgi:hypothetical protein